VISRTGWSAVPGFEVNLLDGTRGDALWQAIMDAGEEFAIRPIAPNEARRVEAGIFNWGSDISLGDTPFHVMGLERLVEDQPQDYIGKQALERVRREGVDRRLVGTSRPDRADRGITRPGQPHVDAKSIGRVTDAVWSPGLQKNIGYVWVPTELSSPGTPSTSSRVRLDARAHRHHPVRRSAQGAAGAVASGCGRLSDRSDQGVHQPPQASGVGRCMYGIQLGHRQRGRAPVAHQHRQRRGDGRQRHAHVAAGVLGERRVHEVDDVDVEVDDHASRIGELRECALRCRSWVGPQRLAGTTAIDRSAITEHSQSVAWLCSWPSTTTGPRQHRHERRRDVPHWAGSPRHPACAPFPSSRVRRQRRLTARSGRRACPGRRAWCARPPGVPAVPTPDGAVATQHEQVMAGPSLAATASRTAAAVSATCRPALRPVGTPAKLRQVSEIEHDAGGRQPFHQTSLA
jgi:hypothetical protein